MTHRPRLFALSALLIALVALAGLPAGLGAPSEDAGDSDEKKGETAEPSTTASATASESPSSSPSASRPSIERMSLRLRPIHEHTLVLPISYWIGPSDGDSEVRWEGWVYVATPHHHHFFLESHDHGHCHESEEHRTSDQNP